MTGRVAIVVVGLCAVLTTTFSSTVGTAHAQTTANGQIERADEPIPDQYIVRLRDTAASPSVASRTDMLAGQYSGRVLETFDSVHGFVAHMTEAEALALSNDPAVEAVEEDGIVHATTTQAPTPSWGLDRVDQARLPLDSSYTYDGDGTGVTAFVIDSGVLPTHTDFGGRATIGADFVNDAQNGVDCSGHGTHVSGTIGGTTYGIAKAVQIVAVRVLNCNGTGSISQVLSGVNWVTTHHTPGTPAVANMSLGSGFSNSINAAVESSISSGVTYVLAAGNGNQNSCDTSPASAPHAITVGATSQNDARASFSDFGPCVDLFAPGVGITSDWYANDTATNTISGTSMASPHVAGVVARYLSAHPTATPDTVAAAVTAAACHAVTNPGTGSNDLLLFAGLGVGQPTSLPSSCGGEYTPVTPRRILDTRGIDSSLPCNQSIGVLGNDSSVDVQVAGCGPIPSTGVAAVVMNVTVDAPTASSYLTVWPSGGTKPEVSNLNFAAGQTVPNLVTVKVGGNGKVSAYNLTGSTQVIFDVVGWYGAPGGTAGSRFHPETPDRVLDTRGDPSITCNPGAGALGPVATRTVQVGGCGQVPGDGSATAVAVNVTVTQPTAPGFLNVFPGQLASASTSSLNFVPALTVPNLVIVQLSPTGTIKLFNSAGFTHVIVDVVGWYDNNRTTEAGLFTALVPARVLDTRATAPVGPDATYVFTIAGNGGVPLAGASAVVMNVTVTDPTTDGFLTVFPSGGPTPPSSNLNFVGGQTVPNLVMVGLGGTNVSAYNKRGFTQVIYDVGGWFTSS